MNEEELKARITHLRQVEKLTHRQIAAALNIGRGRVGYILGNLGSAKKIPKELIVDKYVGLIAQWYKQYPKLQARQIYERLQSYGYQGSYITIARMTQVYRQTKQKAYHPLTFLPGEEAQVDWFFFKHDKLGYLAGFVYVLSYSRYAWGVFYPKTSFEFFLSGHLECFKHIGGLAHCHRYDNLKSVIIKREPQIEYNAQFLDFANFYGFKLHVCNPYSGNEKGRVERLIRDVRVFLYGDNFTDLNDLNRKFHQWLEKRNNTIHRSTGKMPKELLCQERLLGLPQANYVARRIVLARVSKTARVEFDANKYSVPTTCVGKNVEIIAYTERIEVVLNGTTIARHKRCFGKQQVIDNPLHAEKLINITPKFKMRRILQLITHMDESFNCFISHQEDDPMREQVAYELFTSLKSYSKIMLISAVKELNTMRCYKLKALRSLLNLPQSQEGPVLWPQNNDLLKVNYQQRSLNDYDELI